MDAICLVCESAYEVEGELDLLVQIECPKCHRGILMLDAEEESDITHYDVAESGIFDTSPPEPLDVAASVLLGGPQDKTPSAEDRWIAQAEDISLARETPSMTTIQTDAVPLDSRLHDNNQTVDSNPMDAAAMSLYNSEPEDLSRTLPEIPNPYAEPLPKPTPVPIQDMLDDPSIPDDAGSSEELSKSPDTEVEMMPYGTGTAVDLPPIAMPPAPDLSTTSMDLNPLADLEGMLDSAITSLPVVDTAEDSASNDASQDTSNDDTASTSTDKPVTTQEHASFDQAFSVTSPATLVDDPLDAQADEDNPLATLNSAAFPHVEPAAPEDDAKAPDEDATDNVEVKVTTHDHDDSSTLNSLATTPLEALSDLGDLDKLEDPLSTRSTSLDLPSLEDAGEPEEDSAQQPDEEEPAEVALNPQILDESPLDLTLGGTSTLVEEPAESLLPPTPPESYDPEEPHELEPLNPDTSSTIDADAFSFDLPDDNARKTRPLRPVQVVSTDDLPSTADLLTPKDEDNNEDDEEAPVLLTLPSASPKETKETSENESSEDSPATNEDTNEDTAPTVDEAPAEEPAVEAVEDKPDAEEAAADEPAASEPIEEPVAAKEEPVEEAPEEADAPVAEVALTPIPSVPVPEPPSSPSGEMIAPRHLTPAPESAPARARTFSLAPPVDNTPPPKELNRTLAFGFKLPEELEEEVQQVQEAQQVAAAPQAPVEEPEEELELDAPEVATPGVIAAVSGSFDIPKEAPKEEPKARSSEALPMAGFGKLQDEPPAPSKPDPALAETQEAPEQEGMIDFDNLSADFFDSPASDKRGGTGIDQLSDLDELIQKQQEDQKQIIARIAIAVPVLIILVILMFWGINQMGKKGQVKPKTTKRRVTPPPRKAPVRVAVRPKARKIGAAPLLLDAGTAPDAAPDAGSPDSAAVAPRTPDAAAPRVLPRRVIPPRRRIRRRPPPRRRIRRRPPPRRRIRRRPPPRRRIRRRPPPRRRYNRAAAKKFYALGQKQLFANNINGAIRQYKRAIRADSRYANAYRALGAAYMRKGNKPAAKRAWRTFLRLKPKDPMAKFIRKMIK